MIRRVASAALLAAALLAPSLVFAQNTPPDSSDSHAVFVRIEPPRPCPDDPVSVVAEWCHACVEFVAAGRDSLGIFFEVRKSANRVECNPYVCAHGRASVPLGLLQTGFHTVLGRVITHPVGAGEPTVRFFQLNFAVGAPGCGPSPSLPYVDRVRISGPHGDSLCAGQPILVRIGGRLPSDCHSIRRIVLYDDFERTDFPSAAPVVRILVDDGGCLGRPCVIGEFPWEHGLRLPPLPVGASMAALRVEVYQASCTDSFPPDPIGAAAFPFEIHDCVPTYGCLIPKWTGAGGADPCHATVTPTLPAVVTLKIASTAPLAGLQGKLELIPSGLRITSLLPTGGALGMNLSWQPLPGGGAAFVMFSENGSTIPASNGSYGDSLGEPVLRVHLEPIGNVIPQFTRVYPNDILGSDAAGNGVFGCVIPANVRIDPSALICAERPCDANADGMSDVRDLVLMVNCLHDSACTNGYDCDQDQDFSLADVICCALRILRHHAPPDSGAQPGDVRVELGLPVHDGNGVSLPVTVLRGSELGASLLQLRYPSGRYRLEGVDYPVRVARLALHSNEGDDLALGLVKIPAEVIPGRADIVEPLDSRFVVRLRLRPGMEHGGRLDLVDGQFATLGGNRIDVRVPGASMPIVAPVTPTISPARPNPFARATSFSVDLPSAGAVDVTVHDLSGRRVATLFRGELPAGSREFSWRGTLDRGGAAVDGVYFLRLAANGRIVSRKVVVLRSP